MSNIKVFHKSVQGTSHIASGKPCQDYSVSLDRDGIQVAVVCDGHGGNTYVRSDIGAKIAAELTKEILFNFGRCTPDSTFVGRSFSITAKPKHNPFVDTNGTILRFDDLDETQKQYAKQAQAYLEAESNCIEQQKVINELIDQIYTSWLSAIEKDRSGNQFNKKELKALAGQDIAKAYGCTLLAFLKTEKYWIAFQIGDGSIYCCDQKMSWEKPVPDDCSCFLNYTTSLCDLNPLTEFRYAFSGVGDIPLAVILCSDGVDGSLHTKESIQDFYDQIIGLHLDGDDVDKELTDYLPTLSANGNKDDVSLAGIVDLTDYNMSNLKKAIDIKKKERRIRNEYRSRKYEIDAIYAKIETLGIKLERLENARFMKRGELDELRKSIKTKEKEVADLDGSVDAIKKEIEELGASLEAKRTDFERWKFTTKNEMAELEIKQNETEENGSGEKPTDYTSW